MSKADGVFIYIGTYASEVDARADYDVVKDLHAVGRRRHLRRRRHHQGRQGEDPRQQGRDDHPARRLGRRRRRRAGGHPVPALHHRVGHRRRGRRRRQRSPVEGDVPHRRQGVRRGHRRRRGRTGDRGRDDDRGRHREGDSSRRRRRWPRSSRWTRRMSTRRCRRPRSRSPDPPHTSAGATHHDRHSTSCRSWSAPWCGFAVLGSALKTVVLPQHGNPRLSQFVFALVYRLLVHRRRNDAATRSLRGPVRARRPRQPAAGLDDPHDAGVHRASIGARPTSPGRGPSRSAPRRSPPWGSPSPRGRAASGWPS